MALSLVVQGFSGTDGGNRDQLSSNSTANGTTVQAGSITPSENNELVVFCFASIQTSASSIDSGYTKTQAQLTDGGFNHASTFIAYKVQTTATATNPTATAPSANGLAATILSFKAGIPPVITSTTIPSGDRGAAYSTTLSATGAPTSWSIVSDASASLSINNPGVLSAAALPNSLGDYTVVVRATNASGSDDQTLTLTVVDPLADLGDELDLTGLEITPVTLNVERLKASFGSGYGATASVGPGSGLWGWELASDALPDAEAYGNLIQNLPRFQYYTNFFLDHTEGTAGDTFRVDFRGKQYHAGFSDDSIGGSMQTYDLFDMSGVKLEMRRRQGVFYNDDGSILVPYAWIRADKIVGLSDGDSMVTDGWTGYAGTPDWTVASDGTAPTYETNETPNGGACVRLTDGDLTSPVGIGIHDIFIVLRIREATFSVDRGVCGTAGADDLLEGENGTTKFKDLSLTGVEYRKNGTLYTASTQQAPMNVFGVVHLRNTTGTFDAPDGMIIGQDPSGTAPGDCDVAEVVIPTISTDTQISDACAARITAGLKNRWGITATS